MGPCSVADYFVKQKERGDISSKDHQRWECSVYLLFSKEVSCVPAAPVWLNPSSKIAAEVNTGLTFSLLADLMPST